MIREHVRPTVRLHYVITDGGKVPNVVPDTAQLWLWVRDFERAGVEEVLKRVRKAAEGAALAAGVESRIAIQTGSWAKLANRTMARLFHSNMVWLGPIPFTEEEQEFAREIQSRGAAAPAEALRAGALAEFRIPFER